MSGPPRDVVIRRVLWSLSFRGTPNQIKLLRFIVDCRCEFASSELIRGCGLTRNYVNYFVSRLQRLGVLVPQPRPVEPVEWAETYGISVRRRKRREQNLVTPTPLSFDWVRLRSLVVERCNDSEVIDALEACRV